MSAEGRKGLQTKLYRSEIMIENSQNAGGCETETFLKLSFKTLHKILFKPV